jgi:hypothetical protein
VSFSSAPIRIVILGLALVAAGLYFVRWQQGSGEEAPRGSSVAPDLASARADGGAVAPAGDSAVASLPATNPRGAPFPGTANAPRVVRGTPSAARDAFERAHSLGAVYQQLRPQADAESLFFAERALRECMQFVTGGAQGQPPPLDRYRPAPPDDPVTARRQAAYTALQTRCSGFDLGADPAGAAKALREALLASSGPRAALEQMALAVRKGGSPDAMMNRAREMTADGDPYSLEQASSLMSALRGRWVFMVDGQLVRPDLMAASWMMAACDAGRSCGGEWVQSPCAFLGECDAQNLESMMQRYQLTPSEFDRMQLVRNRIMRGVATGQWDPALFAPQSPPPGYRRWGP